MYVQNHMTYRDWPLGPRSRWWMTSMCFKYKCFTVTFSTNESTRASHAFSNWLHSHIKPKLEVKYGHALPYVFPLCLMMSLHHAHHFIGLDCSPECLKWAWPSALPGEEFQFKIPSNISRDTALRRTGWTDMSHGDLVIATEILSTPLQSKWTEVNCFHPVLVQRNE